LLSSGEVLVTGGTTELGAIYGVKAASSYNPLTNTWTRLADMNAGRFYPTNATLANGDVVVISGTTEDASPNLIPQVWQVGSRS
jgi:galactose oxidase